MWARKECPTVPSLEDSSPSEAKRFTPIKLCNLVIHKQGWIKKWMNTLGISSPRSAVEFVIEKIRYPFRFYMPTDKHTWNAFDGKACYTLKDDFWQTASETLMTYVLNSRFGGEHGYGDCEDTSILLGSMLEILGVPYYVMFGYVFQHNVLLGGHGWVIAKLDGKWRLVETTLEEPLPYPDGYIDVDGDGHAFIFESLTYDAIIRFNSSDYYEWENLSFGELIKVLERPKSGPVFMSRFSEYVKMNKKRKHSRGKDKKIKRVYRELFGGNGGGTNKSVNKDINS